MNTPLRSTNLLLFMFFALSTYAQELDFLVTVKPPVQTANNNKYNADGLLYRALETDIKDFFNKTKWTDHDYLPKEKIKGTVLITILNETSANSFEAEISVKTSRPIYNSDYETPIINFLDKEVKFNYIQGQALQKSDKSFVDNLSSTLSFYALLTLGFDYDSFELYGGEEYFNSAREVFNALPNNYKRDDSSWSNQGLNGRSKYFVIENIQSPRLRPFRQIFYEYHRLALDNMWQDAEKNRAVLLSSLGIIEDLAQSYPNNYLLQLFNDAKSKEIVEIFKAGDSGQKTKVRALMTLTSLSNAHRFDELK
jgi:Domain of unknown function (DUF4835)